MIERQSVLEQLRRRNRVPAVGVLIFVGRTPIGRYVHACETDGSLHTMRVDPSWNMDRLDFRSVVGLKVLVTDDHCDPDERGIRAVCAACVAAGAKDVVGIACNSGPLDEVDPADYVFDYRRGVR